ncbi:MULTISPECIES: hypothetical protein [Bacillaceae]|uniref:hypothetical protein n=1 Tax=Bacillaceae TaxID=186817 RepID=UPI00118BEE36|nr:hypothetical protein [Bacillus sp. S3]QCJ41751.1 hypothetical protein FAY30_07545 [Bacillus sp. S3]
MDKAIIFGIYNFVSFHACKTLLNKGIEVIGVQLDEQEKSPLLEEKRFEVGRNANFSENPLSKWANRREEEKAETVILFPIYDLYMLRNEKILQHDQVAKSIIQYMESNKDNTEIVFILPIQLLRANSIEAIGTFIEKIKGLAKKVQWFYVPAIYGPWQPQTFLYHQAILSTFQKAEIRKDEREWTGDVLYIDDAINTIINTVETENSGRFIVESGKNNYWANCAAFLQIDEKLMDISRNEPLQLDHQIVKLPVKNVTPFADSITKQIDHVQRVFQNGC